MLIDPGHGGSDSGATRNGVQEKDLNLAIALKCREIDPSVVLTREDDSTLSLSRRDRDHEGIVVSIHCDAASRDTTRGCRVYVYEHNYLADVLISRMPKELRQRSSKQIKATQSDWTYRAFNVIAAFRAPVLLLECGFMTSGRDLKLLQDEQVQYAIATAIIETSDYGITPIHFAHPSDFEETAERKRRYRCERGP